MRVWRQIEISFLHKNGSKTWNYICTIICLIWDKIWLFNLILRTTGTTLELRTTGTLKYPSSPNFLKILLDLQSSMSVKMGSLLQWLPTEWRTVVSSRRVVVLENDKMLKQEWPRVPHDLEIRETPSPRPILGENSQLSPDMKKNLLFYPLTLLGDPWSDSCLASPWNKATPSLALDFWISYTDT